jgi:hypothetical protein
VTSLPVEKEDYDRLNSLLPRGVTIADEINKFIVERGHELEREKTEYSLEFSPIRSTDYNNTKQSITAGKGYDTRLDEYMPLYENDSKRFKKLYSMSQEELYNYGHLLNNHLTEISSVMWERFKVSAFLNRRISHEVIMKAKSLVYGSSDNTKK